MDKVLNIKINVSLINGNELYQNPKLKESIHHKDMSNLVNYTTDTYNLPLYGQSAEFY